MQLVLFDGVVLILTLVCTSLCVCSQHQKQSEIPFKRWLNLTFLHLLCMSINSKRGNIIFIHFYTCNMHITYFHVYYCLLTKVRLGHTDTLVIFGAAETSSQTVWDPKQRFGNTVIS